MQCPGCGFDNPEGMRFCGRCATSLSPCCLQCGFENPSGFVFCGQCATPLAGPTQSSQRPPEAESRFHALLPAVIWWLQRDRRVTYRTLKHVFGLDDSLLNEIRKELTFKRLALDEDGEGLVWTGESSSTAPPEATMPVPSPIPEAITVAPPEAQDQTPAAITADEPHDEDTASEPFRTTSEAERRQLTVMFCDLADSTKLSQQLDPEDLREVVRAYQATAAEVIEQYEGHMAQYLGDGLLIYFGWPVAHEDDAQRAAYAGLGMVQAITTTLNPRLEQEKGVQLTVRVGIHTGPVVVGEMGGGDRHENLATGETVNIAARLEGLAAPNTVVLSNVTARLVEGAFVLDDLPPHELKGVSEPMPVFRVLSPMQDQDDETPTAGIPFLVGRDEEVGLLRRRWDQSKEGLGQVVLISGEAGIGKSSLVETMRAQVAQEGLTRIAFRCSPYHRNSALYPVITHVEHLLRVDRDDSPETRLDKLERVLQDYDLPLDEAVPLFAALLFVPLCKRYPTPAMTPQQQRQLTLDTLVAWLVEESEHQPVLVVWEDLHWADPSTLEMLSLVVEQAPIASMLHVLTFRSEFDPPWPTRSHVTPIVLNRLERPQVEALITHLADGKALPAEVVQHLVEKTDGVPLFVEELTRMLLESDLLREDIDQYALTGSLATVRIPDTLQGSLMARLDQMNTAKEVAQLGAVLGREFAYELIRAISSQDEDTLQAGLTQLVEAELLYRRGRPPQARYVFKHALIQDAAYASLLRSTRQELHQKVAQLLEDRFPMMVQTQPELVAHHYTEAALGTQAVSYWQQAGARAHERSAYNETISHLTKGLAVLQTLPDTPERTRQELTLQIDLANTYLAVKGWGAPEVEHAYQHARVLCQRVGKTSQLFPVMYGLCVNAFMQLNLQTAREIGEEFLVLSQERDDPVPVLVAHRILGTTLSLRGELLLARRHLEQALALYDPQSHGTLALRYGQDPGVAGLSFLAWVLWQLGYPDQARKTSRDALEFAQKLDHPYSLAYALNVRLSLVTDMREVAAVAEVVDQLTCLSAEHGFSLRAANATFGGNWLLLERGRSEADIAQIQQNRPTKPTWMMIQYNALLAKAYGRVGQPDAGIDLLNETLDLVKFEGGFHHHASEFHRLKGELLLTENAPHGLAEAETSFRQAIDIAHHQQAKSWELRAATSLARLWQSQGKRQEAYDLLAPVYGWFTEGFDTADLKEAKALLEELR